MPERSTYRAPAWLPGPHAQTIWPSLFAPKEHVGYARQRWNAPDGDFIDVDFLDTGGTGTPDARGARPVDAAGAGSLGSARSLDNAAPLDSSRVLPTRPLLVVFHGLEGDSGSHYARALMAEAARRGWRGAVAHFRGCGGAINLAPRAYHSGDSDEIDWILRRFARDHAQGAPLLAAGVSLGGNALLKWLGERAESAGFVAAAAAISPPQDLAAGARSLSRGFNRVYTRNFLRTLKAKSLAKLAQHPGLFDRDRMLTARTFHDFDDAVTAPMHGFRGCHDYWARSSCRQHLGGIRVPTLVLNALNDPFLPASALARRREVSREVYLEYPREGGHVGFIGGPFPGNMHWLARRILDFLADRAAGTPAHGADTMANGDG